MEIAVVIAIAVIAIGIVILPLVRKPVAAGAPLSDEALDQQVKNYRTAIQNQTLCDSCLAANPAGAKFCSDCGRPL